MNWGRPVATEILRGWTFLLLNGHEPVIRPGNGNGMSTPGKRLQHGKPHWSGAKPQPDSHDGQVGPPTRSTEEAR